MLLTDCNAFTLFRFSDERENEDTVHCLRWTAAERGAAAAFLRTFLRELCAATPMQPASVILEQLSRRSARLQLKKSPALGNPDVAGGSGGGGGGDWADEGGKDEEWAEALWMDDMRSALSHPWVVRRRGPPPERWPSDRASMLQLIYS